MFSVEALEATELERMLHHMIMSIASETSDNDFWRRLRYGQLPVDSFEYRRVRTLIRAEMAEILLSRVEIGAR